MAVLTIVNENKTLEDAEEIASALANHGIDYERWTPVHPVADNAPAEEILRAYSREIEDLKRRGDYVTADVIDVTPATPGLDEMLARFNREHWHDDQRRGARNRSRSWRSDSCPARHTALVYPLCGSAYSRHSLVPGHGGLGASLH
jgi:hypothetical protein